MRVSERREATISHSVRANHPEVSEALTLRVRSEPSAFASLAGVIVEPHCQLFIDNRQSFSRHGKIQCNDRQREDSSDPNAEGVDRQEARSTRRSERGRHQSDRKTVTKATT